MPTVVHTTEFLIFSKYAQNRYYVYNKSHCPLGDIFYNGAWRRFVFSPNQDCIFDHVCLTDISNFLSTLKKEATK